MLYCSSKLSMSSIYKLFINLHVLSYIKPGLSKKSFEQFVSNNKEQKVFFTNIVLCCIIQKWEFAEQLFSPNFASVCLNYSSMLEIFILHLLLNALKCIRTATNIIF